MSPLLRRAILDPPLRSVAIEINSACNRQCCFCPNHDHARKPAFLKKELVCKIIDELKDMKFKGVLSFQLYNEPLLDNRLVEFIKYSRKKLPSVFLFINTNGDYLDIAGWKDLRKAGLDFALVSQYDGKVNDNIRDILDKLSRPEKRRFFVRFYGMSKAGNRAGLVKTGKSIKLPLKEYCSRPFYQLCINYQGKAVLCHNDYSGLVKIADVRKESVSEIWRSRIFKYHRTKLFYHNRNGLKLCEKCDNVQYDFGRVYNMYKITARNIILERTNDLP